jgi:Fic family protein
MKRETGKYLIIPDPLPPVPPLQINSELQTLLDDALVSLGRLDSASIFLPNISLFLYQYIRKEAVLSSQIEGTQSSLSDLLLFEMKENPGVPIEDVEEVSCYVNALLHGIERIKDGYPLSLRLMKEIHSKLLSSGRGSDKEPGEFRRSQNWIGGIRPGKAKFVPPPPQELMNCLDSLEKFLNDLPQATTPIIKAGLAHVQFETIHPFLDGNGRVGRLLITLIFCISKTLKEPLLYLSLYFKEHREEYYRLIQQVREIGDWESWMVFFAKAIQATAQDAVNTARELNQLVALDKQKVLNITRKGPILLTVLNELSAYPIQTIKKIAEQTRLAPNTVMNALQTLIQLGIVKEMTGKKRGRLFIYQSYFDLLDRSGHEN